MRIRAWSSDGCSSDLAGPARRQRPRGVLLPVLMLPANLADLGRAVALVKGPERRPGLDRLQLLGIADKDHLRAGPFGLGQYALHLRSEEHTSELQSLMRISYAVFCLKTKNNKKHRQNTEQSHKKVTK